MIGIQKESILRGVALPTGAQAQTRAIRDYCLESDAQLIMAFVAGYRQQQFVDRWTCEIFSSLGVDTFGSNTKHANTEHIDHRL